MKSCEVIVNFDVDDFDILKSKIPMENIEFFTNDLLTLEKIRQSGHKINLIANYFGEFTPDGDSINDESIGRLKIYEESLNDENFERICMVKGFRYINIMNLINLEKIKRILELKQNVVFLFRGLSFYYFAIPDIARSIGYQTKFGISEILNSNIEPFNFQKRTSYFRVIEKRLSNLQEGDELDSFESRFSDISIKNTDCNYGFFLINNETDFYLKPIYPILKKFQEKNVDFASYTFDDRTTEQLTEKGFQANNLSEYFESHTHNRFRKFKKLKILIKKRIIFLYFTRLYKIRLLRNIVTKPKIKSRILDVLGWLPEIGFLNLYELPLKENKLVNDFLKDIKELRTDDVVLKSYLRYFDDKYVIGYLLRILMAYALVDHVFKKLNFKSVLVGVDASPINNVVCSVAQKYKIPTYSIPQVFIKIPKLSIVLPNASKIIVSGQKVKTEFVRLGMNEDRIIVTGSPRYDYIGYNLKQKKQDAVKKKSSKRFILVAMSRWHENDDKWMSQLIRFCNENSLEIIIKIHPMYKFSTNYEFSQEMVKKISRNCSNLKYTISYDEDLSLLLSKAELVITEYSIVAIEAAFNEVPIIIADFNKEKDSDYSKSYRDEGIALYSTTIEQLCGNIEKILHDVETKTRLLEEIRRFNYEFNHLNDGSAAQRVVDLLIDSKTQVSLNKHN